MTKIEEVDRMVELRRSEIAALAKKAETLPDKIEAAEAKAAAAAGEGDYDAYKIAARERDELKDEAEYIRIRLEKLRTLPDVDPELVKAAWDEFCKRHDPALEKKLAEYQKIRQKALDLYGEIVDMHREAAAIRRRFSMITGTEQGESCRRFPAKSIPLRIAAVDASGYGTLKMPGTNIVDPDALFYLSDYVTKEAKNPGYSWIHDKRFIEMNGVLGAGLLPL